MRRGREEDGHSDAGDKRLRAENRVLNEDEDTAYKSFIQFVEKACSDIEVFGVKMDTFLKNIISFT